MRTCRYEQLAAVSRLQRAHSLCLQVSQLRVPEHAHQPQPLPVKLTLPPLQSRRTSLAAAALLHALEHSASTASAGAAEEQQASMPHSPVSSSEAGHRAAQQPAAEPGQSSLQTAAEVGLEGALPGMDGSIDFSKGELSVCALLLADKLLV